MRLAHGEEVKVRKPTMLTAQEAIEDAAELLQRAQAVVALTGTGISTGSGIPDFRTPGSIWQQHPPASYREFLTQPEARQRYWQIRRALAPCVATARPNAAHYALLTLEHKQRLLGVITQNFDGLHQDADHAPERVLELHGTSRMAACTSCDARSSISELQQRVDAGELDPCCAECGGFLKAATTLFGQRVPEAVLARAKELAETCDLFLVVGSSLKVSPASLLRRIALQRAVPLIIVNLQPTSLDALADAAIHEKAGTRCLPSWRCWPSVRSLACYCVGTLARVLVMETWRAGGFV